MNTQEITPKQIFEQDLILTLEAAKTLIGKKLAITNPEYRGNSASVRIFTLKSIESEWDLAGKEDFSQQDGGKFPTRQDYWKSYMGDNQIENVKNNLKLVATEDDVQPWATCDLQDRWTMGGTMFFHGSDADREIYYIVLEDEKN